MHEGMPKMGGDAEMRRNREYMEAVTERDFSSESIHKRLVNHPEKDIIDDALSKVGLDMEQVCAWDFSHEEDRKTIASFLTEINQESAKELALFLRNVEVN